MAERSFKKEVEHLKLGDGHAYLVHRIPLADGDLFSAIARQDILLHHPYQSFQPVIDFIRSAATDPSVVAIKQTIYRTGMNSELMEALIVAAQNRKEVTVVVELMARFDEEANIYWSKVLAEAGATIIMGVPQLKVHLSSADWMSRSFDKRIEVACPIYDTRLKAELKKVLEMQLSDGVKARILTGRQENEYQVGQKKASRASQAEIYRFLDKKS